MLLKNLKAGVRLGLAVVVVGMVAFKMYHGGSFWKSYTDTLDELDS